LWVKKTTNGYRDVSIDSYRQSFRSGMAFLALTDKYIQNPDVLNYEKFSKENTSENLAVAFDLAEKNMGIPKLLEPTEVSEGNVDERSLILYVSLFFHAFVAQEQQRGILEEKDRIAREKHALQGSLEDRAKMAAQLQEDNRILMDELNATKKALEEAQERLKKEQDDRAALAIELENYKKKAGELAENNIELEGTVSGLKGEVADLTAKFDSEFQMRKNALEQHDARSKVEVSGLGVLKKNLGEHLEDLYRWQKYLDLEGQAELDFSGEIRPQILMDISKENFDTQLTDLTKRLGKENEDLLALLGVKEAEQKAKKDADKKKKERQQKNKT